MKQFFLMIIFIGISQVIHGQVWDPTSPQFGYRYAKSIYIEYNGKKYIMPKGIKQFMKDAPMDDELRAELNKQYDVIKKKQKRFYFIAIGGGIAGGALFLSSLAKAGENKTAPGPGVAIGAGIFLGSAIAGFSLKAKKSDYRKFVNTYNAYQKKKIKFKADFSLNLSKQNTGLGIRITF